MSVRLCRECDGDRVVVQRVRYDEVRGSLMYDTAPCPACDGSGWAEVERSGFACVWALLALAVVVTLTFLIALAALLATPRSGPDPTAPSPASDVAGIALASTVPAASASGPSQSGAPPDAVGDTVDGRAAAEPEWPAGGAP